MYETLFISCSTPIRTGTERTKNSSAAITPWNKLQIIVR